MKFVQVLFVTLVCVYMTESADISSRRKRYLTNKNVDIDTDSLYEAYRDVLTARNREAARSQKDARLRALLERIIDIKDNAKKDCKTPGTECHDDGECCSYFCQNARITGEAGKCITIG